MPPGGKKENLASFLTYGTLGIEMGVSFVIGLGLGYLLDRYFHTTPVLTIVFMLFGIVAGFKRLYTLYKKAEKEEEKKDDDR